ncbi:probable dolichyl pyrophosphate Glc1Man9GlcNAc2 alpha-1,3-glucosyltransferase isoform X2 [Sitophilus oryzae]|nr:probable dolichyl pyrophosphate Glc1Man9GlcNAc2 alpha-1,3-glucosyltransferase isoform X2 [Sitophilus oryzae]
MLNINNIGYSSDKTILFQRLSVILTDSFYIYGVYKTCEALPKGWKRDVVLPILLITNCGLLMVDHIHFQYNGIMYGILLLSIANLLKERYCWSAFWFTFLLNMKHIYIYLAPAYFIYLLRHYCLPVSISTKTLFTKKVLKNFHKLASIVISVFVASFGPFFADIPQVLSRLFPFKRGLCHAYWAPNFWALYNVADKSATVLFPKLNIPIRNSSVATMTGGLVQEFTHTVLPNIVPITTLLLTVAFVLPATIKLFFMNKNATNFLRCLVLCGLTAFLFGWHVHEKAILMVIIPLSILSIVEPTDAKIFLILSTTGHYSLFPLLFPSSLLSIKVLLLVLYSSYSFYSLYKIHLPKFNKLALPLLSTLESAYIIGLAGVFLYENVVHQVLRLDKRLPFLPLMLTSVYCALGILYCWCKYYIYFLNLSPNSNVKTKRK